MKSSSVTDMLAGLWTKSRDGVLARVAVLETATAALHAGGLDAEARAAAERAAHKLARIAGTFGYWEAIDLAREAESAFEGPEPISAERAMQLSAIAAKLRAQLSVPPKAD